MPAYPKPHIYQIEQVIHEQKVIKQYWEYSKSGKLKKMYDCLCIHCKKVSPKEEKNLKRGNKCRHCQGIRHRSAFKYKINDEINGLIIINRWFGATETDNHKTKRYDCKCKTCKDIKTKDESTLNKGHGCKYCNQKRGLSSSYKYDIDEVIGTLRILDRWYGETSTRKTRTKQYDYECIRCKYKSTISEGNLKKGKVCPACCPSPQTVVPNLNSIIAKPETHWMIPYFIGGKEEASLYTPRSSKQLFLKCPYCKRRTRIKCSINNLYRHRGISCICGDRISYPERFMRALLEHLQLEFTPSFRIDGVPDKKYDFYIPIQYKVNEPIIIEMHGKQHYTGGFEGIGGRSQLEEKENDQLKRQIAQKYGYKNYIEIDSQLSNPDYIKDKIINSNLFECIKKDSINIDWLYCARIAEKNLVFEVCQSWNLGLNNTKSLSKTFNLSLTTIRSYLKRGASLGWCSYDSREEMIKNGKQHSLGKHPNAKSILCYDEFENIILYFTSVSEMTMAINSATDIKLSSTTIARISRSNKNLSFKDFHFSNGYSFKYEHDLSDKEKLNLEKFKMTLSD